jgi:hypothetical protein
MEGAAQQQLVLSERHSLSAHQTAEPENDVGCSWAFVLLRNWSTVGNPVSAPKLIGVFPTILRTPDIEGDRSRKILT